MQSQNNDSTSMPIATGYKRILVPHDGSEMSDKALVHALYISKLSGAEINIMNVIEPGLIPPSALLSFIRSDSSLERTKQKLRETFENAARCLNARCSFVGLCVRKITRRQYLIL